MTASNLSDYFLGKGGGGENPGAAACSSLKTSSILKSDLKGKCNVCSQKRNRIKWKSA